MGLNSQSSVKSMIPITDLCALAPASVLRHCQRVNRSTGVRVASSCLGDASKQHVERFDIVMIQHATMFTALLPTAVAVVGRFSVAFAHQLAAASADKARVAAEHCCKHVVEVDVTDYEQRSVPRCTTCPALQRRLTLLTQYKHT